MRSFLGAMAPAGIWQSLKAMEAEFFLAAHGAAAVWAWRVSTSVPWGLISAYLHNQWLCVKLAG